ncbi:unnamed protein product [Closterium sp. Yama58-4]|nr:unnamed protein product [Closterium sp. Yama58-4]
MHLISHYVEAIRRAGPPIHYDANISEFFHKDHIKRPYRASNKRDVSGQLVRAEETRLAVDYLGASEVTETHYNTAMREAMATGRRIMGRSAWPLTVLRGRREAPFVSFPIPSRVRDERYVTALGDDLRHLRQALNRFSEATKNATTIHVHNELGIPPATHPSFRAVPHRLRAVPVFHGRGWFSDVAIHGSGEWYAKVLLLFHIGHGRDRRDYAFIKYYDELPDPDEKTHCKQLKWAAMNQRYRVVETTTRPIPVNEQVAQNRDMERTIAQQAETLTDLRQQLEEQEQDAARMRAVVAARQKPAPATGGSPGPSSSNSWSTGAGAGLLHATAQRSSPLATTNAPGPSTAPVVLEGAAIPPVLLDLSFFKQKCNDAVNYFIAGAPAREQSFYPTLAQLRRKVQELYEDVGVPLDMFNRVMAENPERERIMLQKMSERRCNIYAVAKPYAHGPGGYITENKVAMLASENIAPSRRRTPAEWHAHFRDGEFFL